MRITSLVLILLFFWALACAIPPSAPDELQAKLDARIQAYNLTSNSFIEAIARIGADFKIPMGVVWANRPEARTKLSLSWKNKTAREIIETVVQTQAGYEVHVRNGVVHIYPPKLIPDGQNFLTLRMSRFEVKQQPVEVASRRLHDMIRVATLPPKPGPQSHPQGVAGSLAANAGDPKISVKLSDVTVRDILDALVLASARKTWIVTFSDDPSLTATGLRRTSTLWNNSPIPDQEQPVWDLLRWGDSFPMAVPPGK